MEPRVPILRFTSREVPPNDGFGVFHDSARPFFVISKVEAGQRFTASAIDCLVGDLVVSRLSHDAVAFARDKHQVDYTGAPFTLQVQLQGTTRFRVGETKLEAGPDSVIMQDSSLPYRSTTTASDVIAVVIPRSRVERHEVVSTLGPLLSLSCASRAGRSIRSAVLSLWATIPNLALSAAQERADDLVARVNASLASFERAARSERDRQERMIRFVQANLEDPDLGVVGLQRKFSASRATVYRAFADVGGVASYVRRLRLEQCYRELTDPRRLPKPVSDVASKWGFVNPSHFNRLMKRAYGMPPSTLVADLDPDDRPSVATETLDASILTLSEWLRGPIAGLGR